VDDCINRNKGSFVFSLTILVIASFFWGSTFVFSKILVDSLSVSQILFFRSAVVALLLYLFFFKSINREFKASLKSPLIWVFSIIGFLALFVQTMSLKYTTASNSAFITAAFIIFIPIIKRYVYKTNIKVGFYLAVLLALCGLYLISFGFSLPTSFNYGDLLALSCALCYAFYLLFLEKLVHIFSEATIVFFSFLVITVLSLFTGYFETSILYISTFNFKIIVCLLALAVLGGVVPYMLMAKGQKVISAQLAGLVYNLEPIFAAILAYFFIGEIMTFTKLIGCCVVFAALFIGSFFR